MLKQLFSFAVLIIIVGAAESDEEWESFKAKFQKTYKSEKVEQRRQAIFRTNLKKIVAHNEDYEQGLVSYKLGINHLSDVTKREFAKMLGIESSRKNLTKNLIFEVPDHADIPDEINWVELGAVTDVRDQGLCGSCWSFSAIGSIEGQYYIKNQQQISLSPQNLDDCSTPYGNGGCYGGLMDYAFRYVCDNGIMSEKDYPYIGRDDFCHFDPIKAVLKIKTFVDVKSESETDLMAAVGTVGPVSVAVDASGLQLYGGGIFDIDFCGTDLFSVNHGMLVVGYGTTEYGQEYWLVKNSWGEDWGENGYIKMARNMDNQCGIATCASYPLL